MPPPAHLNIWLALISGTLLGLAFPPVALRWTVWIGLVPLVLAIERSRHAREALVLGALAEVDEQVLALDARGVTSGARRTPLEPPPDRAGERALRWVLGLLVVAAYAAKFAGHGL